MNTAKSLTAAGAAATLPSGNAIVSVDANGTVTPVADTAIERRLYGLRAALVPAGSWLRIAECHGTFMGTISVIGTFPTSDGSPMSIFVGAPNGTSLAYIRTGRQAVICSSSKITKVRLSSIAGKTYIDAYFASGNSNINVRIAGEVNMKVGSLEIVPEHAADTYVEVDTSA